MKEEFEKLVAAGKLDRQSGRAAGPAYHQRLLHAPQLGFWQNHHGGHGLCPFHHRFSEQAQPHDGSGFCRRNRSNPFPRTTFSRAKPPTSKACARWPRCNHLELIKLVLKSYGGQRHGGPDPGRARARRHQGRLEEMVGSRQARVEEGRPFPGAAQENRAHHLPGQGSLAPGPFAGANSAPPRD